MDETSTLALKEELRKEAGRIQEDTLYTAKSHFIYSEFWGKMHLYIGLPTAIIAAIAGVSALKDMSTLAGVLAILVAALSALSTFLNTKNRQIEHSICGNRYLELRNCSRIFAEIEILSDKDINELKDALIELAQRRDSLNIASPQPPKWAYKQACAGIANGEADYSVDKGSKAA